MSTRPVQYDAIDTIRCLGYSERQASFIYTAVSYTHLTLPTILRV